MNETIDQVIARLTSISFFAKVGSMKPLKAGACDSVTVKSWDEAVKLRGSDLAGDAFLEASNRLTHQLSAEFRKEYRQWNIIAGENRELLESHVLPSIDKAIDGFADLRTVEHGQELVKDCVRWDLIHYAAEQAYSGLVRPEFYSCLVEVYEAGRFPCYWDEVWPSGRIWVF